MASNVAHVLDSARSLSRSDQAELARELLIGLEGDDDQHAAQTEALREAVEVAETSIAAGDGVEVRSDQLRDHIRRIGREATALVERRTT